jgi:hypothetical protein
MTLEDLKFIFKPQTEEKTKLYFMLISDDTYPVVERHPVDDMESLLPMLDNFVFDGYTGTIPRFKK